MDFRIFIASYIGIVATISKIIVFNFGKAPFMFAARVPSENLLESIISEAPSFTNMEGT